jgi:predicted DNA-binding transcriptional regulator YafY
VPLRRADRLFDIIRILRAAWRPVTAAAIADELEVTVRTGYRDVATLQARRSAISRIPLPCRCNTRISNAASSPTIRPAPIAGGPA